MIVTLTTNPSLDRTLTMPSMQRGLVNRATQSTLEPGGRGVNVSRALQSHATSTTAVLPIGGATGRVLTMLLADAQVPFTPVPIAGALRVNTCVVEPDGTTTHLNEAGPTLDAHEALALLAASDDLMGDASWLAVCGSLAPGLPADFYATAVRRAHTYGGRVAVYCSGPAFERALSAGPDLITPHRTRLAELVGSPLPTLGQVRRAAEDLVRSGIPTVIVGLSHNGALLVTDHEVLHARTEPFRPVSSVGVGDAWLAGILHALMRDADLATALSTGVQWGTATARLPGTHIPGPTDVADIAVTVTDNLDEDLVLSD